MNLADILDLTRRVSVAQLMEHETFKNRVLKQLPFTTMEMLYPLLQGYDSVALKADVEIGATEQKFNLLMGRQIQKSYGQPEQDIITLNYLLGTDGKEKMSKSLGNYIGITDQPSDMYGKVMSIPDNLIVPYYEMVTDITEKGLEVVKNELAQGKNPRDVKAELAYLVVELHHSGEAAEQAKQEFDRVFKNKETPSEIPTINIKEPEIRIDKLLVEAGVADSISGAKRLVEQGAVTIDNEKIQDPYTMKKLKNGSIIKVGRKFVKILQ